MLLSLVHIIIIIIIVHHPSCLLPSLPLPSSSSSSSRPRTLTLRLHHPRKITDKDPETPLLEPTRPATLPDQPLGHHPLPLGTLPDADVAPDADPIRRDRVAEREPEALGQSVEEDDPYGEVADAVLVVVYGGDAGCHCLALVGG